jgi:2',3'-cyclic-nucleotide 2'-phosphodiesterase (5'-nucleotidase family)
MKKIIVILTAVFAFFISPRLYAGPLYLTILHFNDIHGHLEEKCTENKCKGGGARIAAIVKQIEKENAAKGWHTFLLFGGDAFSGTLISSEFKGEAEFRFFNLVGVDAMVIGNHEFDFTLPVLEKRIKQAQFPVLSANIFFKDTNKLLALPIYTISGGDELSIGLIGITTKHTPKLTNPINVKELSFRDHEKSARPYLDDLKNTDVRIALTHMGVDADVKFAKTMRDFDAVIGGHDHIRPGEYCRTVRRIPVCQTPANGQYLGRVDFEIDNGKAKLINYQLIALTDKIEKDKEAQALISEYEKMVGKKYDAVIGRALDNFNPVRGEETNIGDLVSDALRWAAKSDVAFINSGGIRSPIKRGPIKKKDVMEALPFDNYVVKMMIPGSKLRRIFDLSVSGEEGSFLQVSGVSFKISGRKAADIKINGEPLDPEKDYSAATLDFLANGGSGYTILKKIQYEQTGMLARDAVMNYISERKTIGSPEKNRILH